MTTSQAQLQQRLIKTIIFITIAVIANSFGNLMLALGMDRMPDFAHVGISRYLLLLLSNPFILPGAFVSFIYTLAQLSLFSWADLSYVVPCVASSYIVTTLLSEFILNEHIYVQRWVGVVLIVCGVALVAETPECTTIEPDGTEHPC
ncbi:MAG TPA: EamA family transporter [Acidobacteriaceae bacterium]|nr:EamA family transporter [Acidobacteriaceae bacterium]